MSDDINPTFPELEGSWVRKETYDALRKQFDECELALDDNRLGRAIEERRLAIAVEAITEAHIELLQSIPTTGDIFKNRAIDRLKKALAEIERLSTNHDYNNHD